ncbi:TonB-dependent receptor [Lysobacter sp. S4-A87]|uniref:TonB-dependent receptor n=1 Tax=Lysobacter sp. S4-A87 TaxID=2925843 RepID=UPI001F537936|nr:TonB-dependent receptor [Lysobacter sp. S4-A87]UNK48733.1 TonB-dependent receptor [Lysobacter sp. S4-A87]
MKQSRVAPKRTLLTSALLLALSQPLYAQQSTSSTEAGQRSATVDEDARTLDTVVVQGIRGSLTSSMNLKRDSQGVVDGIVAEDIGKFPDTNLAESLQRISGVSIDRSLGEGARVTVRGIGPDYNMVMLNGRQMPASSNANGAGVSNSRAFDFANLASEAISSVEVYKTSRASIPPGGIGATINIRTARPLESEPVINVGMKAVHDTSNGNLPDSLQGHDITPEISGIFSQRYFDGKFGVALTGSYQERDFGFSQVGVPNGWRPFRGDENNWGTIPQPGTPGSENITNRPGPTDIYSVPQNLNYSVNGVQRQRTNGQMTLQWQPVDNVTTTLDYTYSENKIQQQRNELSVWFNYGPSVSSWTDGPVAAPLIYKEIINPATSDVSMGGMRLANVNENKSLGFNVDWQVNDALDLSLDYHNSSAETRPDSPWGSAGVLGMSAFVRGDTTADFSRDFPVLTIALPPGVAQVDPSQALVSGSVFNNAYNKSEIEQTQVKGRFEFGEYSGLDFGASYTDVENRTAFGFMQRDTWGGVGTAADYDDSIFSPDNMGDYFESFSGHNDPAFTDRFLLFDFDRLRARAAELTGHPEWYRAPDAFTRDLRTEEKSTGGYMQYTTTFNWSMPLNLAAGVRYEKTEVTSSALVPNATGISWSAANELNLNFGDPGFATLRGEYDYWLPNLDASLDITDSIILRGSYSQTIGRPGWADIQGGRTLDQIVRVDGGTGTQGDPTLKPLLSDNFDLSFEWYFAESSYVSVGYFRKDIENYIGTSQIVDVGGSDGETPFNLHTPVGGGYWNAALANGCPQADVVCIRNYILGNFNGQPGVTATGTDANGNMTGTINGLASDPLASFRITTPANKQDSTLDGWEFNVQHVFGETGFGIAANYTIVDSPDLNYDNAVLGGQFALVGLSDSANLVLFYEKYDWSVRTAYNWRDQFLSAVFDGSGIPNPNYVDDYGQLDISIGYQINEQMSVQFEGINITDETVRVFGRNERQTLFATQNGPRYMLGFRYQF